MAQSGSTKRARVAAAGTSGGAAARQAAKADVRESNRRYMAEYRKTPQARLRAEVAKAERLKDRLRDLIQALREAEELGAAEALLAANATLGCALAELNAAIAALPSVGDYDRKPRRAGDTG